MKEEKTLKPLYIIGAGGFEREVAWLVERINSREPVWALAGFIDDDASLRNACPAPPMAAEKRRRRAA